MSAQHRKPVLAFVALALVAAALVGVQRADAQSGRLLAAAIGASVRVQGTLAGLDVPMSAESRRQVAALGPVFEALTTEPAEEAESAGAGPRHEARRSDGARVVEALGGRIVTSAAARPVHRPVRRPVHRSVEPRPRSVERVDTPVRRAFKPVHRSVKPVHRSVKPVHRPVKRVETTVARAVEHAPRALGLSEAGKHPHPKAGQSKGPKASHRKGRKLGHTHVRVTGKHSSGKGHKKH